MSIDTCYTIFGFPFKEPFFHILVYKTCYKKTNNTLKIVYKTCYKKTNITLKTASGIIKIKKYSLMILI